MMTNCFSREAKLACQYTYQVVGQGLVGFASSSSTFIVRAVLRPAMRSTPTVTLANTSITLQGTGVAQTSGSSSITATGGDKNLLDVSINGFSLMTAGAVGQVETTNALILDAELL